MDLLLRATPRKIQVLHRVEEVLNFIHPHLRLFMAKCVPKEEVKDKVYELNFQSFVLR